jgi:3-hydroxybutyryl-CoA dehydrogenase
MEITKVGVIGLGSMGAGIAQLSIEGGFDTIGREVSVELGEKARAGIAKQLARKVEKGQLPAGADEAAVARLAVTDTVADLADCDLVIEAVFENLKVKQELFTELEKVVRSDAILATNTSALSVTEIASVTRHPERVVGMHFFNPAPLMPLVEIVRAERTEEAVSEAAFAFAQAIGKEPIRCGDTPGFVVNRILIPLLNDCIRVIDEAGVTIEDLDKAMRFGAGWPMGPATLTDLIGLDVAVHASEALYATTREPRMAPPARLVRMVKAGKLGRKSGEGFYRYE